MMKLTKIGFILICLTGIFLIIFVYDMYNQKGTEYAYLVTVANTYIFHQKVVGLDEAGYHIQTLNRYDTYMEI